MGRKIGKNLKNIFKVRDPQTGDWIALYYRSPNAEEMVSYFSGINRDKYETEIADRRIHFALDRGIITGFEEGCFEKEIAERRINFALDQGIITGFEEGCFEKEDEQGKFMKFSSDEAKVDYDPEWREKLKDGAADILTIFSTQVFEVSLLTTERYTEKNS